MREYEKMVKGLIYNSSDEDLLARRERARLLTEKFNQSSIKDLKERTKIIEELIPNHGKNMYIEPNLRVEYGTNISFGDNFFMNFDGQILDVCPVEMGDNVYIGARVTLATPVHPLVASERKPQIVNGEMLTLEYAKPIKICNDVWIASSVTVCGGVTIGEGAVVGAGSVVTRDIPAGYFACGVPCRPVRKITENDKMFESQGIYLKEDK